MSEISSDKKNAGKKNAGNKWLVSGLKFLILVGVLTWIGMSFKPSDWQSLVAADKHWSLLFLAFALVIAGHIVSYCRWYMFIRTLGVRFEILDAIRLGFLGNLFNFVSLGAVGGDVFKALAATRSTPGKRTEVAASVLVDRGIGLLGLLVVAVIGLQIHIEILSPTLIWIWRGAWLLSIVGIMGLVAITLVGDRLMPAWVGRLPVVGHTIRRASTAGLLFYGRPALVVWMLLLSCLVHSLLTLGLYAVSRSMYFESSPTAGEHFMVVPPAFAAAALPLTPGGLGVQEVAVAKLFEELPKLQEPFSGLLVATMYRVLLILVAAIGGVYYVVGKNRS